jgi:hypothetical protein
MTIYSSWVHKDAQHALCNKVHVTFDTSCEWTVDNSVHCARYVAKDNAARDVRKVKQPVVVMANKNQIIHLEKCLEKPNVFNIYHVNPVFRPLPKVLRRT